VDDREFLNRVAVLCHRKQIGQLSRINLVALVPLFQQGILARIARSLKLLSNSYVFSIAISLLGIPQNSKSRENWIWRAPVPAIGCLNPGIGVRAEPTIWETFRLLNKLKNSATTSRRFELPNGKYFRTRKSIVASAGLFREFLPRATGLAESGKA